MSKVKYVLIFCLTVIVSTLTAQTEDPFRTLSGTSGTLKVPETNEAVPIETQSKKSTVIIKEINLDQKELEVLDPQYNKIIDRVTINGVLSVELVSLIGDIGNQTVELTIRFTNHQTNRRINIHNLTAYDNLGDVNSAYGDVWETFTDVPVKATFKFKTKVLPTKVHKMNVIKIPFASIRDVEFRNIEIDWR
ncbi:hypothetical protein LJC25_00150 [Bacteroidales bacterium OttesenSCG-928-K03]|nr:hypothetical protein [Bacteroidales bacterium OttesenSCG-928-K03]